MIGIRRLARSRRNHRGHTHYKDGKLVSDETPGRAGNHGLRLPCQVVVRDPTHPIMKGLPKMWIFQGDELYSKLRGPGKMTVLATAYSDPANRGTENFDEPSSWFRNMEKVVSFIPTFGHDNNCAQFGRRCCDLPARSNGPLPERSLSRCLLLFRRQLRGKLSFRPRCRKIEPAKGSILLTRRLHRPGTPAAGGGAAAKCTTKIDLLGTKQRMKTIKGPGIFLAQFAGDQAPYCSLNDICRWAASLGFKGVQIPTWDNRFST